MATQGAGPTTARRRPHGRSGRFAAVRAPGLELLFDRRSGVERRTGIDRRAANVPVAVECRRGERRGRAERRWPDASFRIGSLTLR